MNSFFDKNFNLQYQKSRFTRAFYDYGAPLDGFDAYITSSEQTDQENQFSVWWADEGLRNAYCVGGRSCTGEWDEVEPTVLVSTLLIQVRGLVSPGGDRRRRANGYRRGAPAASCRLHGGRVTGCPASACACPSPCAPRRSPPLGLPRQTWTGPLPPDPPITRTPPATQRR